MLRSLKVAFIAGLLTLLSVPHRAMSADPSISKPRTPVAIHGLIEESKKIAEQAEKDDATCTQLYEQMKKSGPKPDAVNKLATSHKRLQRLGKRLMDLGEPAGAEYRARGDAHRKEFEEAFNAFSGRPEAPKFKAQSIAALQKSVQKRRKKAEEIANTAGSDIFAAETSLDQGLDELEMLAGILAATERGPFGEYIDVESHLRPAAKRKREEIVNIAVNAFCAKTAAEMDTFVAGIQSAAMNVKNGGTTWGEKSMDSLAFLDTMFREGFAIQAHLQRAIGYQHLIVQRGDNSYGEYTSGPPTAIDPQWAARLRGLKTELGKAAVAVIEKDSKDQRADGAMARFAGYATTLGKIAHRADTDEWVNAFDEAIFNASRRVVGAPNIQAYQQATNEVLRWKERFANKRETAMIGKNSSLATIVSEATKRNEAEAGYILTIVGGKPYPQFHNPSYEALPLLGKKLGTDPFVIARNVVHMNSEDPIWVSRWENYIYARMPKKFLQAQPSQSLQKTLVIDDKHPAFSVRAASAVYTAERGDDITVGGTISEVFVEGAATRIAALPDIAAPFVGFEQPVGLPREPVAMTAALRAAIKPKWYRHRYFVAAVSGDSD